VLTTPERANAMSKTPSIRVTLRGFRQGRA